MESPPAARRSATRGFFYQADRGHRRPPGGRDHPEGGVRPRRVGQPFSDDDEAIAWANDVEYGLAASVWTQSARRGLNAAAACSTAAVWLNDHFMVFNEMPHGGFKHSGYGKDMSMYGLDDYTIVKHVLAKFER